MSSGILDKKIDIFDIKKTPEIYPMTSMQETFEYLHDQMNLIKKNAYENSAVLQRIDKQVQQLRTQMHKPAASTEKEAASAAEPSAGGAEPEPKARVQTEKPDVLSMLFRRFSEQRPAAEAAAEAAPEPQIEPVSAAVLEPESDTAPERQEAEALHFRRFSEQQLEGPKREPDPDSELDLSPSLWRRLSAKYAFGRELALEAAHELDPEPQTPACAHAPTRGLKRLSLCMMPPDDMHDVLAVISPDLASRTKSPAAPAPSPAVGADAHDASLFLR